MGLPYWKQVPIGADIPLELRPLDRILIKPSSRNDSKEPQHIPKRRLVAIDKDGQLVLSPYDCCPKGKLLGIVIGIRRGYPHSK